MKKSINFFLAIFAITLLAFKPVPTKLVSKSGHISFFSHTAVEDITANNYKVTSTIETTTGDVVFSVPMQSFEFEKSLMQEHYNSKDFLNTKAFPKAKFTGKITNLNEIDFTKNGTYNAMVTGDLTIKETTKPITSKGTVTVKGGVITSETKFNLILADYAIMFKKGKPSTNIAKEIEITVHAEHQPE